MKHAREDYDRIQDPAGLIPKDEPVFLIRAQDPFGPPTLEYYAQQLHQQARTGADHAFARLVERQAAMMRDWQQIKARKDFPDAPGINAPETETAAEEETA